MTVEGPERPERNRVIAADRDDSRARLDQTGGVLFDGGQRLRYRVGVGTDIAGVDHLLDAERLDVERRIVNGAQHPGRLANRLRTETGARPVAGAGIKGDAENRNRSL